MTTLSEPTDARVIGSRLGLREQVGQIWAYRHLLLRMVRKELKVKYKNSFLGFFWSMLNPALYLVVFWLVFQVLLQAGIPNFPIYLLSGLLAWNVFSTGLSSAAVSITMNGALVSKVYFPREILPLASVGAALVHFFLQSVVLLAALVAFRYDVSFAHALAIPPALVSLLLLTSGLAIFLAAANVYLRDTQHLVELGLLAWFWMTPIVYQQQIIASRLDGKSWEWVQWLNPMTSVVLVFQRGIFNVVSTANSGSSVRPIADTPGAVLRILPSGMDAGWYLAHIGAVALVGIVILILALAFFGRVAGNLAEEI
ncbi:MAG: ABC transporter permease [Actinobacteria bacterium]|nr:ABC transporter permease [Actinomycetota bacterium]